MHMCGMQCSVVQEKKYRKLSTIAQFSLFELEELFFE